MPDEMLAPGGSAVRLEGRRVVVTGATSGLGLAMAVAAGAEVAMAARPSGRLAEVTEERRSGGFAARALPMDVRDERASAREAAASSTCR